MAPAQAHRDGGCDQEDAAQQRVAGSLAAGAVLTDLDRFDAFEKLAAVRGEDRDSGDLHTVGLAPSAGSALHSINSPEGTTAGCPVLYGAAHQMPTSQESGRRTTKRSPLRTATGTNRP